MTRDDAALTGAGEIAQDFLGHVGRRIRERRLGQHLTVQQLADRSGISRRLLTQIEHGQANPSLVAITRIARQLGTDFTVLVAESDAERAVEVVQDDASVLIWSGRPGSTARLLVATAGVRTADLWRWRLAPGDAYQGQADPSRSQELFHVLEGTLTLVADGVESEVVAGASARLRSDRSYAYVNRHDEPVEFLRVVALTP